MKILFVMRLATPAHSWRAIVEELCRRGHDVVIVFDRRFSEVKNPPILGELTQEFPAHFSYEWALHRADLWRHLLFPSRQLLGWRRYFFTKQTAFFRERWIALFPRWLRMLVRLPFAQTFVKSRLAGFLLERIEKVAPHDRAIAERVASHAPDVVAAPIANMRYGTVDVDYLRTAQVLKIPIVGWASSWDSVTTKGIFRPIPDLMIVWNSTQAEQAREHHAIARERTRVAGAPQFDKWFDRSFVLTPREEFCRVHGLRFGDPMLLWLGATAQIATDETPVIRELRQALDQSDDERMRQTQIIVRPHPAHARIYDALDLHDTIILPRGGSGMDKQSSQQLFYDCVHHAVLTLGIYTSAMMDTVLAGRPVAALLRPEYEQTQMGTEYFQGLRESGVLQTPRSFDELFALVKKLLDGDREYLQIREKFIDTFIRPLGRSVPAAVRFAQELEGVAGTSQRKVFLR